MDNTKIAVQNLTDNDVVYIDDNGGIARRMVFHAQQTIQVEKEVIERMQYDTGGSILLKDFLSVKDEDMRADIGIPEDQIEYNWTKEDVKNLLTSGEEDALRDALDFAPQGIIDMIIDMAVDMPLNDRNKVEIIAEATGRNIEMMINNKLQYEKASDKAPEKNTQRRSTQKAQPGRRVPSQKELDKEASENNE